MMASLYQSSSRSSAVTGSSDASIDDSSFRASSRQTAKERGGIVTSAAGRGALDRLNCFVHGDAIDMEKTSRFACGKGDAPGDPYRKPLAGRWFPGNAGAACELNTAILFPYLV